MPNEDYVLFQPPKPLAISVAMAKDTQKYRQALAQAEAQGVELVLLSDRDYALANGLPDPDAEPALTGTGVWRRDQHDQEWAVVTETDMKRPAYFREIAAEAARRGVPVQRWIWKKE